MATSTQSTPTPTKNNPNPNTDTSVTGGLTGWDAREAPSPKAASALSVRREPQADRGLASACVRLCVVLMPSDTKRGPVAPDPSHASTQEEVQAPEVRRAHSTGFGRPLARHLRGMVQEAPPSSLECLGHYQRSVQDAALPGASRRAAGL